ncbi:HdeD family acid-resistance protein [Hyalangium minutum]|uniref:Putative membrane protein n=1 Tax=Hyalangium minutum TaxID=394096 RepID=A0A085WJF8_9BACT|nr:HdeD family acid-resistance protein [Hyalangium minutum]KFE67821.1 putative membrane protein [Hyalangium minutum]
MAMTLANRWWTLALRGIAALAFGVLTFISPGSSLLALVFLFGAYALVDGVLNLGMALVRSNDGQSWGSLIFEGAVGILVGVLTIAWTRITALALLLLIAFWALITGAAEVAAAIRLRKQIKGEWLMALSGVLSIAFGVLLLVAPAAGALAVILWIGAYAIIFGALMLGLSLRLRSWSRTPGRRAPPGGVPTPA